MHKKKEGNTRPSDDWVSVSSGGQGSHAFDVNIMLMEGKRAVSWHSPFGS